MAHCDCECGDCYERAERYYDAVKCLQKELAEARSTVHRLREEHDVIIQSYARTMDILKSVVESDPCHKHYIRHE